MLDLFLSTLKATELVLVPEWYLWALPVGKEW